MGGSKVSAGSYALFTIPQADKWTIILSNKPHQWGSYGHQQSDEVARFSVPVQKNDEILEYFSIVFGMTEKEGTMYLAWDDVMVAIPIGLASNK